MSPEDPIEARIDEPTGFEIAVVGGAGKFPGARNLDEYWEVLRDGRETVRRFTRDELIEAGSDPDLVDHPNYVPVKPMLEDIDLFDASYFNYSPHEAAVIDPQGRLFLELAVEALNHAGYDTHSWDGLVGVYAGSRLSSYMFQVFHNPEAQARYGDLAIQTGGDKDYFGIRVSYKLDLGGPSINVQTACSTGLVAVHLACQALVAGECDLALAGGASLWVPQKEGYVWMPGSVVSRRGQIRAFDADADGTIFGDGMGLVALRRLEDAIADRDRILAVIKGSAVANDGAQRVGFTAPGVDGQRRVVRAAQMAAEVDADTITHMEAHGTGTSIGDPIELQALTQAFRETTDREHFCSVSSVKSNIGHLSSAAGIASLLKAVLSLQHRYIPPTINFERLNPQIDLDGSPFVIRPEGRDWEVEGGIPRRVGVSAFGIGGTDAHVILEEAPTLVPSEPPRREHQLIVLSARTPTALDTAAAELAEHLEGTPAEDALEPAAMADVAFTLQRGRQAFERRRVAVVSDRAEAVAAFSGERPERLLDGTVPAETRPVVWMFSGQGSQHPGMGRDLYRTEPVFQDAVDRCAEILEPLGVQDLRGALFPEEGADPEAAASRLERTELTQPALFAVEYALAELWKSWGATPTALIGHSIGEYVAACVAGVFRLEDALAVVAARGRLMQAQPAGDMLSVPLAEDELKARMASFPPQVSVAALNAPGRAVVSGPAEAIEAVRESLEADGVATRPLRTSHAFHSGMMEPMLPAFLEVLQGVELQPPSIPFVSNVSGDWITDDEATDPGYWARHVCSAVRFADGLATIAAGGPRIFLEVGPGKTLATLMRQHRDLGDDHLALSSMRHPKTEVDDGAFALETLGRLWLAGVPVDWAGFHGDELRSRVTLPSYPFERRSYWIDAIEGDMAAAAGRPKKRSDLGDWFHLPSWQPSVVPSPEVADVDGVDEDAETADAPAPQVPSGPWVLFADGSGPSSGLADALAERLAAAGRRSVRVERGEAFRDLGEGRYSVGRGVDGYASLLAAVDGAGKDGESGPSLRFVHLWNTGAAAPAGSPGPIDPADPTDPNGQGRAFWSVLDLVKALGRRSGEALAAAGAGGVRLAVVTSGMQQVAGEPVTHPERATVLGPVQVAPAEDPRLAAAALDVPAQALAGSAARELAEALIHELDAGLPDRLVAYRPAAYGIERFVRSLAPIHLAGPADEIPRLREGGTYLITGGLGGFGRTFAGALARDHRAKLVLVGRSALPPREEWDAILQADATGRTARKIETVRELEADGAEVLVQAADVTDAESMGALVRRTRERFGPIHGVIHAAGVPGGGMIQLKERDMARAVLAPKVEGTLALEAALAAEQADDPVDFLLLCSSTIAVLGGFGQVDYCAANNFLDAYARSRAGTDGRFVVSVNWSAWKDVGMAAETTLPTGAARAVGTGEGAGVPVLEPFDGTPLHPLLDRRLADTADGAAVFALRPGPESHWVLDEHRIQGRPAMPGTSYLEMIRAAWAEAEGDGPMEMRGLLFLIPILVPDGTRREIHVILDPAAGGDGARAVRITSAPGPDGPWTEHARGTAAPSSAAAPAAVDLDALRERCAAKVEEIPDGVITGGADRIVSWGPRWNSLRRAHLGDGEGVVRLELPEELAGDVERMKLHPALVDVATSIGGSSLVEGAYLPLSYRTVRVHAALPAAFDSHIRTTGEAGRETVTLDISFLGPNGETLVEVEGFTMKRVGAAPAAISEAAQETAAVTENAAARAPGGAEADEAPRTLFGADGMTPSEGVEVLRRILAHGRHAQIAVSPRDLAALEEVARRQPDLEAGAAAAGDGGADRASHPRPELATPYAAPRDEVEEALAGVWASILGVAEVGIHDNFFDLGGDSILGLQIVTRGKQVGLELAPELLFEHQTVAELAARIDGPARAEPGEADRPAAAVWDHWLAARAPEWRGHLGYWLDADLGAADPALPASAAKAPEAERRMVAALLDGASTARLREAAASFRATLEELVLSALLQAARAVPPGGAVLGGLSAGAPHRFLVDLVTDGREAAPPDAGIADAAEPLPYSFPLRVEMTETENQDTSPARLVRAIKEQRRAVPESGLPWIAWLGHGPDEETVERLRGLPVPRLALRVSTGQAAAAPAEIDTGEEIGGRLGSPTVELRAADRGDEIELEWWFDGAALSQADVESMAAEALEWLDCLGRPEQEGSAGRDAAAAISTVDFPEADLDQDELASVLARLAE